MKRKTIAAALAAFCLAAPAWALNRCTDSGGHVSYQTEPCGHNESSTKVKIWDKPTAAAPSGDKALPVVYPDRRLQGPHQAKTLIDLYDRWIDVDTLARSTGRIALAGPVGKMQDLQREAEATPVAPCATDAKAALVALMTGSTNAMIAFMRQDEIDAQIYDIAARGQQIHAFENAVHGMNCGKP